jgi:hypothetical protein
MKLVAMTTLMLVMLLGAGCGGEVTFVASTGNGTIVVTTASVPTITLAQYRQDTASRIVFGSIDFYTPGADAGTMTITVTDSRGVVVSRSVDGLAAFDGLLRGTIPFSIDYVTFPPDTYTFTIFLTSRAGSLSNPVFGSFRVL